LTGLSVGSTLIHRVKAALETEPVLKSVYCRLLNLMGTHPTVEQLKFFKTLSPIPGFRTWLHAHSTGFAIDRSALFSPLVPCTAGLDSFLTEADKALIHSVADKHGVPASASLTDRLFVRGMMGSPWC
jgi:hypothetical protein